MLTIGIRLWTARNAGAGTGGFSPLSLSPDAWYDPSDLSTLFQERGGGTTPSVVNGVVGTIRDKSGNGRHLSANTDAARPLLRQSGALYSLQFDGVDDVLTYTGSVGGDTEYARYSAVRIDTFASTKRVYASTNNSAGNFIQGGTTTQAGAIHTNSSAYFTTPAAGTAYTVAEMMFGGGADVRINAVQVLSGTGYTPTALGGLTVGAWRYNAGANYFHWSAMSWFGLVHRSSATWTAGQLTDLETYYKAKAGL